MPRALIRILSVIVLFVGMFILPTISFIEDLGSPETEPERTISKLTRAFFQEHVALPKEFGTSHIFRMHIDCDRRYDFRTEGIIGIHPSGEARICTAVISYTNRYTSERTFCSSEVAGMIRFALPLWETGLCARSPYDGLWEVTHARAGTFVSRMTSVNFIHTERGWEYFPFTALIPLPKQRRYEKFNTRGNVSGVF